MEVSFPVFEPLGKFKILWEILMLILTFWNLVSFSLFLSFGLGLQESISLSINSLNNEMALVTFQIMCFVLYNLDILIKFNTGIYREGVLDLNRKSILKHYVATGGLAIDILGTVPFWPSLDGFGSPDTKQLYFLSFKLHQLRQFYENISEALFNIEGKLETFFNLFKLLFTFLGVCHIFACIWHYQAKEAFGTEKTWVVAQQLEGASWQIKYMRSLYFVVVTLTAVGHGDITPNNNYEYFVAMACMLIGCGLIGYSINCIGIILRKQSKQEVECKSRMQIISAYLRKNKIENSLRVRIRKYLEFIWKIESAANERKCEEILHELPISLKNELLKHSRKWVLQGIFGDLFQESTFGKLASCLVLVQYRKEDWIFQEGDANNDLLLIVRGSVDLILNEGKSSKEKGIKLSTKQTGESIGLVSFILDDPKMVSARAGTACTVFKLKKEEFLEILKQNPPDYEQYCFMRDKILLFNDMSVVGRKCKACGNIEHSIRYCPHLSYMPFKEIIIKRYLKSYPQTRAPFKRRSKGQRVHFGPLSNAHELRTTVLNFRNDNLPDLQASQGMSSYALGSLSHIMPGPFQDLNFTNERDISDFKFGDESKEVAIPSKEELDTLNENFCSLQPNLPFSNFCFGKIKFEKQHETRKNDKKDNKFTSNRIFRSVNSFPFNEDSVKFDSPSGNFDEIRKPCFESRYEDRSISLVNSYDEKDEHGTYNFARNAFSQKPVSKIEMVNPILELDLWEDPENGFQSANGNTVKKDGPSDLFDYKFDIFSNFSIYFPKNNIT